MRFLYITPLFLYFPSFLPGIETQPFIPVMVATLALFFGKNHRAVIALISLSCILLFWIALRSLLEGTFSGSIELIQLLIGPIILFGALGLKAQAPSRKIMAFITFYFALSAALEILTPSVYDALAQSILSRSNVTDGHRGISLFTPEPTYAAITVVYFLVLAWWSGENWGFKYRWIEPILFFCLIATGSTYVVLLLLAFAYVRWFGIMILLTITALIMLPLIGVSELENEESIRLVVAISRLLSVDFSYPLSSISNLDSSLGSRIAISAAGLLAPLNSITGHGLDCFSVTKAFDAAGFGYGANNEVLISVIEGGGCLKPQSYLAAVTIGLGAFSIIFMPLLIYLIFSAFKTANYKLWTFPLALMVVMLVVQAQLSNPVPWMLLFLALTGHPKHLKPIAPAQHFTSI
jgi:hypothetical protein